MDVRQAINSEYAKTLATTGLRQAFLVEHSFERDALKLTYSHIDRIISLAQASPETLGDPATSNRRTIYKLIVPDVLPTCQLSMGMTKLEPGSLWNTMPCHTHERRMEVYFYFNVADDAAVFHMMGEPHETRHIVVRNEQAVISPSWSIHSGVGTRAYTFIWGMVGENQVFGDMDHLAVRELR